VLPQIAICPQIYSNAKSIKSDRPRLFAFPLFGKQIDNFLPVWRLGHALEKTKVALDILAPDEPIYLASKNPSLGSVEPPEKTV
jgi:hypothetical protein